MKTYLIRMDVGCTAVKVKAHSIGEAVNRFKRTHKDIKKGWGILDRTRNKTNGWKLDRVAIKHTLTQEKDIINSVWRQHEEIKGLY